MKVRGQLEHKDVIIEDIKENPFRSWWQIWKPKTIDDSVTFYGCVGKFEVNYEPKFQQIQVSKDGAERVPDVLLGDGVSFSIKGKAIGNEYQSEN